MLETMGNPKHKFGFFIETEAIVPEDYKIFDKHPDLYKQFDLIFTNSKKILDSVPNARFAPMNCSLFNGNFCDECCYKNKTKIASILSSDKKRPIFFRIWDEFLLPAVLPVFLPSQTPKACNAGRVGTLCHFKRRISICQPSLLLS